MDDIFGSYILQKKGFNVVFGPSTVYQDRNVHDLTIDMKKEYIGYENVKNIIEDESFIPMDGYNRYMFESDLEYIDALNADNVNNMAQLENILEFHNISMSKDDNKYIMEEYSACDKVSKDVISWYYRNKNILKQMKEWYDIYNEELSQYKQKVSDVKNKISEMKKH